jgi:hypothetical protein
MVVWLEIETWVFAKVALNEEWVVKSYEGF